MKFNSIAVSLFSLNACLFAPNNVQALKCGSAITKDCIGDLDVRYDADASNNLADQADIWKILPGLYVADSYYYDSAGEPMKQDQYGFDFFPIKAFMNITVVGSRFYIHNYHVARNSFTGLFDGASGGSFPGDVWYTSTFEKDGSAQALAIRTAGDNNTVFKATTSTYKFRPVNDRTIYGSGLGVTLDQFVQLSFTCVDKGCDNMLSSAEVFDKNEKGRPILNSFQRLLNATKVDENEWISTMDAIFDKYSVPLYNSMDIRTALIKRPRNVSEAECASGVCPSEADWQTIDPNFNKSPYQEPDASLTAGFIAGITIGSFVIVAALAYMYHRHLMKEREQRLKTAFARAVAATIDNRTTAQNLSAENLKSEFDSIDTDNDGTVSKEELRSFISNGNITTISDKDFDVLFATIDLDGNASLDFSEFCSFFAYIRGDFDTAIKRKSVLIMRKSTINLMASKDA